MAVPIEMHKGNERKTVYSSIKENALLKKGWMRVSDLTDRQRELLEQGKLPAGEAGVPLGKPKPPDHSMDIEQQLEAETGRDFQRTGDNPPTFVETDKPAPKGE